MDISTKQEKWRQERPLFEAEFIHSHLLPFFDFNENTGDYEIKSECVNNTDDEDRKVAYETLNTGWVMWLRAKRNVKARAVLEGFVLVPREMPESFDNGLYAYSNNISIVDSNSDGFIPMSDINHAEVWKLVVESQEPAND